jgi:hypothetical protein
MSGRNPETPKSRKYRTSLEIREEMDKKNDEISVGISRPDIDQYCLFHSISNRSKERIKGFNFAK